MCAAALLLPGAGSAGDAVHGARIAISGAGSSTVTAASGMATVELAPGRYTATATAVGYADAKTAFPVAP
jgi:hypothetical protein